MQKNHHFYRSRLPSGPIKLLTKEQMLRSQVRIVDNRRGGSAVRVSSNPPSRVANSRLELQVQRNVVLEDTLELPHFGGNSVDGVATAPGVGNGD